MTTLVIADHEGARLKAATLNTISAARQLNNGVHVLVAGHDARGAADASWMRRILRTVSRKTSQHRC
jgi:electron transfer flavoprotein alpha subunit